MKKIGAILFFVFLFLMNSNILMAEMKTLDDERMTDVVVRPSSPTDGKQDISNNLNEEDDLNQTKGQIEGEKLTLTTPRYNITDTVENVVFGNTSFTGKHIIHDPGIITSTRY